METKSILQTNVNVIKIVNLKKGDVYKRITDSSYQEDKIKYGIVVDLYNDGEKTFIETVEYTKSYQEVNATINIMSGIDDISIFPTTIGEVKDYFDKTIESIEEEIKKDKDSLQKKIESLAKAKEFVNGEKSKKLTEIEYKELPQSEYNQEKKDKAEKVRQLQEDN